MTMTKSISSPNQVVLTQSSSQIMMDEHSHASSMEESGVMNSVQEFTSNNLACSIDNNASPQSPSSDAASMVDETTVYENASTDSSDIEEASEAPERLSPLEETKPILYKPPPPRPVAARQLEQEDCSTNNNFPVISLHDSQHSIVSGLTMGLNQSLHQDNKQDSIDKLRAELLLLKRNVLKEGELSKDELVNCLDRIHEELGVSSSELTMDVLEEDYVLEGSDQEWEGTKATSSGRHRKKSKDRGGRKTPRSASRKKKKSAKLGDVPVPPLSEEGDPKTPTSSNKRGSSRRKQRSIKSHSERATRKSAPVLDSEDLRRILKGEGTFKLAKEERSQSTRSTKSSTKSKGRSSSLNPKNRSPKNSMEFSLGDGNGKRSKQPKTKMQSTNPILDFSGALGDTSMLKKKTAPRRKSAPMNVTDFDAFCLRQKEKEAEKSQELQMELEQKERQPRVRGQSKKHKKMARRKSAPLINTGSFGLEALVKEDFANFQAFVQQESFDTTSKSTKDGENATVSTSSKDAATISTNSKDGDEESTSNNKKTKKKKKKKVSTSRRQSMSAIYMDPTGQITRVDLSPARQVSPARSNAGDDGSASRKKKKSRKPKNRRASMESNFTMMVNKPLALNRQTTFDGVIQRYQKTVVTEEETETPITSKKKKQPRRASITDFTFVSNHSYVDGFSGHQAQQEPATTTKPKPSKKKKEPNATMAADMNVAATLASLKVAKQQQDSFDGSSRSETSNKGYAKPNTSSKSKSSSATQQQQQQPESFKKDSWLVDDDDDESDSPVPVVKRNKMQQAKRKSSKFFSKTVAALVSPRSNGRRKLKWSKNNKDDDPFSA